MQPQNARSRRTHAALLEAARAIVEEEGSAALTMSAVAERAGVTRRSLYLRFGSRTQLLTALFDHVNEQEDLTSSIEPVRQAPDAGAALDAWAGHVARFHPRVARIARAIQSVREIDPDAAEHWSLVQADWRRLCLALARRTHDEGVLAPGWTVETMADMLQAMMSLDVLETLLHDRSWSAATYASHLGRVARATFLRPGGEC